MAVSVVGSIAFDSVRTPFGEADRELGGSGLHAALTAAAFTDVLLVAAVGDDFGPEHDEMLRGRRIDTSGVAREPGGRTLSWTVRYDLDLALAQPEALDLGVVDGWRPRLSAPAAMARTLFLGVMDPETQLDVRSQWQGDGWVVLDTLRHWVETRREKLLEALAACDVALLTDQEARGLTGRPSLLEASREIQSWGPEVVVVKQGEYGCSLLTSDGYFALPGYPLETVVDPTGGGDAFAGGVTGYLDLVGGGRLTEEVMRRAVTHGIVMASFAVEDFGSRRTAALGQHEIDHRLDAFRRVTHFEHVPTGERPLHGEDSEPRLPHPGLTPSTRTPDAPHRTPSTEPQRSFESPTRDPR
ncbi:MAG TPA: PfkB family carbohydrate kinase [Solirubrobacteraceae bacterium]|nr:PfkB family carbohydrate kinase [Solirubrobacteraceae bacterium]